MDFQTKKQQYLDALYKPDKSKKGYVDDRAIPIIDELNKKENYVTTSSCSGRVVILARSDDDKKHQVEWSYVSHSTADPKDVIEAAHKAARTEKNRIWLKMEAPIFHVMCRTLEAAQILVTAAVTTGFKYSGIISSKEHRFMVEIMACEKMETLIGVGDALVVSDEYLELATHEANKKLTLSHNRLEKLLVACKKI